MIVGIGLSAKFVEEAGADLIIIYNSGRFRMAGRGSLAGMMPYGDANAIVVDMVSVSNHRSIWHTTHVCRRARCFIHRISHHFHPFWLIAYRCPEGHGDFDSD